jgi:DHA2 family multidrug resistance protein
MDQPARHGREDAKTALSASRHERALVVLTVLVGTVSTLLAATIVNVAFPALMQELHVGNDSVQWVATGFLAATTSTMLGAAWGIERYGERNVFIAAMVVFAASSILGMLAWNLDALIAARVLQGGAAGIVQPLSMVSLFRVFPPEARGRAMGLYGFGIVLAPAVGPALGGALVDAFGWRSIFALPLPFCVIALVLAARTLSTRRADGARKFDFIGTLLLIAGLVALLNVPVAGHRAGWGATQTLALGVAGIALGVAFVLWERHSDRALLRVALFRHLGFTGAALVAFAYGAGLFGTTYLLPVLVQQVAAFNAAEAGVLLAPAGVALAFAMTIGGRLTDQVPVRYVVIAGLLLFAVSSALFMRAGATTGFWVLAAWIVIGRIGLGFIIPALNVGAVQALEGSELTYASAGVNFIRQLGGAVGVNVLAVLLEWRQLVHPGQPARAFHECFGVVTLAFLLAVLPAAWIGRRATRKPPHGGGTRGTTPGR